MSWLPKSKNRSKRHLALIDTSANTEEQHCVFARHGPKTSHLVVLSLILNVVVLAIGFSWYAQRDSLSEGVLTYRDRAVIFDAVPGFDVPPRQQNSLWEGLTAVGSGSLYIDDPVSFSILGSRIIESSASPSNGRYYMAMFHQLHCLAMLKYVAGTTYDTWHNPNSSYTPSHLDHCFDYLRQSIMCAGDVTLEPILPDEVNEGWGIEHQCRDYDAIQDFVTARRIGNSPIIDE